MFTVIKLINVHYHDEYYRPMKVQFKITVDDIDSFDKRYYIITNGEEREVTREEGNKEYKRLREQNPDMRALILIDRRNETITHVRVAEHFEVYLGSIFICSCDDIKEVREAKEKLRENLR